MTKRECVSADGVRVVYESEGSGDALLLLHGGFVQSRRVWAERGWLERLAREHRVILVDLRGHGESSRPKAAAAYGIEQIVLDLRAVLDAERVECVSVVGYSFGAIVGARFATHERRVAKLVLIGGAFGESIPAAMQTQVLARLAQVEAASRSGVDPKLTPMEAEFVRRADLAVVRAAYTAMPSWPRVEPEDLRCPTLFIAGTENPWSMSSLDVYRDRLAKCGIEVALLPGASHEAELAPESNALERTAAYLRRFGSRKCAPRAHENGWPSEGSSAVSL